MVLAFQSLSLTSCTNWTADRETDKTQKLKEEKSLGVSKAIKVERITGYPVSGETIPSPNNTPRDYDIGGTDLGIFWKMEEGKVGILFGDTYGKGWNAMGWSTDKDLTDGLKIDGMITDGGDVAKQIIFSATYNNWIR